MIAQQIKVLIVDDSDYYRMALILALAIYPQLEIVGEADSGTKALLLCATQQPDIILLDWQMPDMNGEATTRHILQQYPHICVLILTSEPTDEVRAKALQVGAKACLSKSLSMPDLESAIRQAIQ